MSNIKPARCANTGPAAYPRIYTCDLDNHRKYCIILGQLSQAELLFPAGCYFYTLFAICDVACMPRCWKFWNKWAAP